MKPSILIPFLLLSMYLILPAQENSDSSLIAYYRFNANTNDSGIYQNHGTAVDLDTVTDRFGTDSTAFLFNGSSGYVTIPNSQSLSSPDSQITHLAWIYMYGWSKTGSSFNPIIMKSNSGTNAFQYRLSVGSDGLNAAFNNWNNFYTAPYDFIFYRWYLVAVTFARDTLSYYVDGELIHKQPFQTELIADDRPLEIGRDVPGIIEHFNGKIDEVRLYNRALSANEITMLYDRYHQDNLFLKTETFADTIFSGENYGLAWGDFDNDDDQDLYSTRQGHENVFYINNGDGTFKRDTLSFPDTESSSSRTAAWADLDNDDDLDLFVINWGEPNRLYLNNSDGTFALSTDTVLSELSRSSSDCDLADFDLDGFVDIFVANRDHPNELYRNNGDGTFSRIDTGHVATDNRSSVSCRWIDYDVDGDPDIYVTNTYNQDNFLYRNDSNARFTRIDTLSISNDGQHGASSTWADFDNDGDMDLFISHANYGDNNYIYRNNGNGDFELLNDLPMRYDGRISASSAWGDIDNDGDLDLAVANGGWYTAQKNLLYRNTGNGEFETVVSDTFVNEAGQSESLTLVDWDGDGLLELVTANRDRRSFFYENASASGNNWVALKCTGTTSNRSAIGATVHLLATIDGKPVWQMRVVSGHNGRRSQSGLHLHFGLGDAVRIDSLKIRWPSGLVETYGDLSLINELIRVTENGGIVGLPGRDTESGLANTFRLMQNYPNPFNPVTTIQYTIGLYGNTDVETQNLASLHNAYMQRVDLSVYNVLGQKIVTLVTGIQNPGTYTVQWDGRNYPSGVYYYRLMVDRTPVAVRKMVLIK